MPHPKGDACNPYQCQRPRLRNLGVHGFPCPCAVEDVELLLEDREIPKCVDAIAVEIAHQASFLRGEARQVIAKDVLQFVPVVDIDNAVDSQIA